MLEASERQGVGIRVLHKLVEALARAQTTDQVYAFGLNAIHDIFNPDHAFVLLAERSLGGLPAPSRPECIPIRLGDELLGKFMLQYDSRPAFTDHDLLIAELISVQVSLAIQCLREKYRFKEAVREKDELVAMALHEIRSPLAAIMSGVFLLRSGRAHEVEHAIEMIDRNARSQRRLIDDLLDVCELDAENRFDNQDSVSVNRNVIKDLQP